ncbi:TolC family outer membrane protein [Paraburkholderia sp. MMS20-SJTR3]|uniref:TolC family outer membrane protein n=1 Tax=Paraburkholderia sejongensis TaxID=2886946 RepID=A0ABS8JXS6_9BURK|nr:TolC family outer membrane protein [Paraburkholderia sp. MMS20-SJTR3]MCC8394464.1 TolC family outer membrane protein [Paraburkholderia sp. MMS20-SJTR3]
MNKHGGMLLILLAGCIATAAMAGTVVGTPTTPPVPPAPAVDLMTIVDQAIGHDADLAAAEAGYAAARQARPIARAALLPRIDGGWGRGYNRIANQGYTPVAYWQSGWTVSLSQPLFDWARWTGYQQADLVEAQGALTYADARQSTILHAAQAYFDELAAEDELQRATDYRAAVGTQLDELRRRRAAGDATLIDLREADALSQQAQLQQLDATSALHLKRQALELVTGQPFTPLSRLAATPVRPRLEPADLDSWVAQASTQGYTVQLKQLDSQIAKLDVSKTRAAHYPVVNLQAGYTPAGAASGYARPTTTTTAMLTVTIPLYSGGEIQARLRQSFAQRDQAEDAAESAAREAGAAARDAYTRFTSGLARIDLLARIAQSSRDALAATRIGYRVGSRTSTDVLRATDTLYTNQRDLLRARYDTILALLQLKAQTAALNVDEVAAVNAQLAAAGAGSAASPANGRNGVAAPAH